MFIRHKKLKELLREAKDEGIARGYELARRYQDIDRRNKTVTEMGGVKERIAKN